VAPWSRGTGADEKAPTDFCIAYQTMGPGGTGLADGDKQMRWNQGLAPEGTIRGGKAIACHKTGQGVFVPRLDSLIRKPAVHAAGSSLMGQRETTNGQRQSPPRGGLCFFMSGLRGRPPLPRRRNLKPCNCDAGDKGEASKMR